MKFEMLLRELRIKAGMSQKDLADRLYTSPQNISAYERLKNSCTFDMGMSLLDALGVSVVIKNNKIIVKDDEKMNKTYKKDELEFINFNTSEGYEMYKDKIKSDETYSTNICKKAFEKLDNNGYDYSCSRLFSEKLGDADFYPPGETLVSIHKDNKEIRLISEGGVEIDFFLFESFISDIKEVYPQEGLFIEKAIMFECINNDKGSNIYEVFKHDGDIRYASTLLCNYEDIIEEFLSNKDYFFTLTDCYNPRELTISNMLGIYDCFSSSYPYYAFKMPNEEFIIAEESFEGHDISEALLYATEYFENDYNRYLNMYEEEGEEEMMNEFRTL